MTDFRLTVFCSVARNLNFTKASRELNISQPAISKHIQELEQEYNTQLFIRHSNRVELTPAGELLLSHAEVILHNYHKLNSDMSIFAHALQGKLRLGASSGIAHYILPPYMASFADKFKNVHLSLIEGNSLHIEQALQENRIDIALVESCNRNATLRYTPFMRDDLVVVTSTRSKWAHINTLTLSELAALPIIVRDNGVEDIDTIAATLHTRGTDLTTLNITATFSSIETLKNYLTHTHTIAILSHNAIQHELSTGTLKTIKTTDIQFTRHLTFVRNITPTPTLIQDFINYITR